MIKILLVGCGYWGKNWYNTILSSEYELVGVVDPNPVIDVKVPLFKSVEDVTVMYTHVIIATNAELHLNLKNQLKVPDKNILVEKPCGTTSNRNEFSLCFPGYIFLSSPQYKYIKNIINKNILGNIIYSRFERASMGPRLRTDISIIEDYAIHDLYLYQALFDPIDINIIDGKLLNSFNNPIQHDTLFLNVSTSNHIASFFSSWRHPVKSRKIEIVGCNGSIVWKNDNVYFYPSCYKPISGLDANRNIGYELVDIPKEEIKLNTSKSNLHLQLYDFITQENRSKIFKNTNNFILEIKKILY